MRARSLRWSALVLAMGFLAVACSSDVTTSEEYLALQAELDEASAAQGEAESQNADLESQKAEADRQIESLQQELAGAEERADSAESKVSELEVQLEEEINRIDPYPDVMVEIFVDGCTEGDPSLEASCLCTIEELQHQMPLGRFFEISEAFAEVELDPVTGEPSDLAFFQIEGAETFFDIFFDCLFA